MDKPKPVFYFGLPCISRIHLLLTMATTRSSSSRDGSKDAVVFEPVMSFEPELIEWRALIMCIQLSWHVDQESFSYCGMVIDLFLLITPIEERMKWVETTMENELIFRKIGSTLYNQATAEIEDMQCND